MSHQSSLGTSIYKSVRLLEKLELEISSLFTSIQDQFDEDIEEAGLSCLGDWKLDKTFTDEVGSVATHHLMYDLPVGRKRKVTHHVTVQVALSADYFESMGNTQPLVHVYVTKAFNDGNIDVNQPFSFEPWDGFEIDALRKSAVWLLNETDMLYSIALTHLNCMADIKEKIVVPVVHFISQDMDQDALMDAISLLDGIARYSFDEDECMRMKIGA